MEASQGEINFENNSSFFNLVNGLNLDQELYSSAFSKVYKVKSLVDGQPYALKKITFKSRNGFQTKLNHIKFLMFVA